MEKPAEEHEHEEGEISDDDRTWVEGEMESLGRSVEPKDVPFIQKAPGGENHSPILRIGTGVSISKQHGRAYGAGQLEISGRQREWGRKVEVPPFSPQPDQFFQMAWQKGVQGNSSKSLMEESRKEEEGHLVESVPRDLRGQKGVLGHPNSVRENFFRADRINEASVGVGCLLLRSSSWIANRDFDLHLTRKADREAEYSSNMDRKRSENGNLWDDGRDCPRVNEETWRGSLEMTSSLSMGCGERTSTLKSTIEKVDREASISEGKEIDKTDEIEVNSNEQHSLPEELLQSADATHSSNDNQMNEELKGELEEGEIVLASSVRGISPVMNNASENDKRVERSVKSRERMLSKVPEKFYVRSESRKHRGDSGKHRHATNYHCYLAKCAELVKNVSVKDAQKSFVSVCRQLRSALTILADYKYIDSQSPRITALARQAFSGIRAAYAVRNTASGKEQEQNRDFFPRLLELAYESRRNLFTSVQIRELESMLQTSGHRVSHGHIQKDYRKEVLQFEAEIYGGKNSKPGELSGNASTATQLEAESITEAIVSSGSSEAEKESELAADTSAIVSVTAGSFLSTDLCETTVGAVPASTEAVGSSLVGFGGWFSLSSEPVQGQDTVTSDMSGCASYSPFSVRSLEQGVNSITTGTASIVLATDLQPLSGRSFEKQELFPSAADQKGAVADIQTTDVPLKATDKEEQCSRNRVWSSVLDPLSAVTSYHEKFAGKSGMAYARLPSPTPSEEDLGDDRSEPLYCSRNKDTLDIVDAPNLLSASQDTAVSQPTLASDLGSDDVLPITIGSPVKGITVELELFPGLPSTSIENEIVECRTASKIPVGFKGSLKSRDPRRRLVNTPPACELHKIELNEHLVGTDSNALVLGSQIEEGSKKDNADGHIMGEAMWPTRCHGKSESPEYLLNELQVKGGWLGEDVFPAANVELKDMEIDSLGSCRNLDAPNTSQECNFKRDRDLDILLQENRSCMGLIKKHKFENCEQEICVTSLAEKLNNSSSVKAELPAYFDQEFKKTLHQSSSWDTNMKRDRVLGILPKECSSSMEPSKRQKFEVVQQEIGVTSLADNSSSIKTQLSTDLNQECKKIFQQSLTTSIRPAGSVVSAATVESAKPRMKSRDPRRILLGSTLDKNESPSLYSLKGGSVTASTTVSKDGILLLSQAAKNESEVGFSSVGNSKELPSTLPQGGLFPNAAQKLSVGLPEVVGSSQSSSLAGSILPFVAQNKSLVPSKEKHFAEKLELTLSTSEKDISDDASSLGEAIGNVLSKPSLTTPLGKNDLNGTTGLLSLKHQGSSSHWETLEHLLEGLDEKQQQAVRQERARRIEEQNRMLSAKKLCLVLDLDHTLLNSAKFSEIEEEWQARLQTNEASDRNRVVKEGIGKRELYRFPHMGMWTKLRPGIWNFLARASQLYELHVYTMGNKVYATEMAKLLDPTGTLFAGRVISKGDDGDGADGDDKPPKSKDLDGVLGMESAVVIIDDSARVWPHHRHNLIVVERYMYFPCSRRQFGLSGPSLLEVGHDEREVDGMLSSALAVIDKIHFNFFSNQQLHEVDVRDILATEQHSVLAGCKIIFSRVFPQGETQPHLHPLWQLAEQFGAVCTITTEESVTHVVAISLGTDKVNWALATGRFAVRPAWLEASAILYRRANERDFPVPS